MTKEMTYGVEMERLARNKYEELYGVSVEACGLFTDIEFPFLAASPDSLIDENCIIEIKCPYVTRETNTILEAIENKLLQCCTVENNVVELKKDHKYYFQVIGQLRITNRTICHFVIFTPNWINVQKIEFDEIFWKTKMEEKLKTFYLDCLLPEIACPLYGKRLELTDIREPRYILNEKEKRKNQKIKNGISTAYIIV
ncbi:uncharacterized protein LOC112681553 [Sipha flava]|uniref:Uncharacterized protein LOC112681553 n=1 Tax=Sipha flava TaxID=143950 RepID=A0A2S2QHC7_9HEMI|nr:uncharacterized protein LOC112681553 [Sipha flava]